MKEKKLSILVVDHFPLLAQALSKEFKSAENTEVEVAVHGQQALNLLMQNQYDITFLDVDLPTPNAWDILETLIEKDRKGSTKVVVVSSEANFDDLIRNYSEISGYMLKNASVIEWRTALVQLRKGERYYTNEIFPEVIQRLNAKNQDVDNPMRQITPQEFKVLKHVCRQMSSEEIANEMNLSINTIIRHRHSLKNKVGVKNSIGLALFALQNKIMKMEEMNYKQYQNGV